MLELCPQSSSQMLTQGRRLSHSSYIHTDHESLPPFRGGAVELRLAQVEHAEFARTDKRRPVPVIEYQNVSCMLADLKMTIESARYLT
jgi:hypothetical protein